MSRKGKEFFCSPEKTKHPLGVRKEHMWSSGSRIFPWHFTIIVRENCLFVLLNYAGQLYSQLKVLMKYFPLSRGVHCNFFLLMHSNKKFEKKKVNTIKESLSENVPLRDRNQMYIIMKNTQSRHLRSKCQPFNSLRWPVYVFNSVDNTKLHLFKYVGA